MENCIFKRQHTLSDKDGRIVCRLHCYLALKLRVASCAGRNLAEVPNDLPSNIVTLDLGLNKITALLNDTFQRYRSLTALQLLRNDLRCIELKALYPLTRLEKLDLSNNVNLILHTGEIFRFSQNLAKINLMSCGLLDIPDNFLEWLPNLKYIDLSNNNIVRMNLTSCGNNGTINGLWLQNIQFTNLTYEFLNLPCKINVLFLTISRQAAVDSEFFATIKAKSIMFADLNLKPKMWSSLFKGIGRSSIEKIFLYNAGLQKFWKCKVIKK